MNYVKNSTNMFKASCIFIQGALKYLYIDNLYCIYPKKQGGIYR